MSLATLLGAASLGSPIPTPSKILAIACAALLAACLAMGLYAHVLHVERDSARALLASEEQRIATLQSSILAARKAVEKAEAINRTNALVIDAQTDSITAAAAKAKQIEADKLDARAKLRQLQGKLAEQDAARIASKDLPPPEEMATGWARWAKQL